MKNVLTLVLFFIIIVLSIWSYNSNIQNTKIISSETKIDPVSSLLTKRTEEKKQYEKLKLLEIKNKQYKNKVNKNVVHKKSKISRGENIQLIPIKVIATGYSPFQNFSGTCNDGDPTNTSTGAYPKWGTIASDPKELPYQTKLFIEGYNDNKICTVEDTGSALRNDKKNIRIDLYFDTYKQAMDWGRREITVYIVKQY